MNTVPLPPPDLMFRVSGGRDGTTFLNSGKETLDDFSAALLSLGKSLRDFDHILDFGCGCGRLMRWLDAEVRRDKLHGSDIDAPAVEWLASNMPGVDVKTNEGRSPFS